MGKVRKHTCEREKARNRRQIRVRKKVNGTIERPRLNVFRSLTNIYVQIIDDENGKTLVSASSLGKDFKEAAAEGATGGNITGAKLIGKLVAEKAQAKEIKRVVFDRGGYLYTGRVKSLAEEARKAGLDF
jgi:large subunit ribosomal protein L18